MSQKLTAAFDLLNKIGPDKIHAKAVSESEIGACEKSLDLVFPDSYRRFLSKQGYLEYDDIVIFGLGVPLHTLPSVECAVRTARAIQSGLPSTLIPIHVIANGVFACIAPSKGTDKIAEPPIIIWYATRPTKEQSWKKLSDSFADYFFQLIFKSYWHNQGFKNLQQHVNLYQKKFEYDHSAGGKLPRNTDWRPYRYCIQDVVFGTTVVRHHQEGNCLEVDVFLTADIPEYGPLAGARALTAFILSEAYKCGGTMELRFTNNVEGGQIPNEIRELALQYGVHFKQKTGRVIEPSDSKALYVAMTGLSRELENHIKRLEVNEKLKLARACYVIHHGIWTREQVEMIVLGSDDPDDVLSGDVSAEHQHLYYNNLLHARAAVMTGIFERIIVQRQRQTDDGIEFDMEDDFRQLEISFDGDIFMKKYISSEDIELNWLLGTRKKQGVQANMPFHVLIRARNAADLYLHLQEDLNAAKIIQKTNKTSIFLLIPSDFHELPITWVDKMIKKFQEAKVGILVCPENTGNLDADAGQRLDKSRILRK